MKIKDEALWQQQRAEFAADPNPLGKGFEKFVITWAELAEDILETRPGWNQPLEALRERLRDAEERAGHWTVGFLGQALITLMSHWAEITDPKDFAESMTPIEANVVADTMAAWKAEANRRAQGAGNE